jgi:hypothetical protein
MAVFAGGSAIQYHERHFFYLQLLPWCAFGILAEAAVHAAGLPHGISALHIRRALMFSLIVVGVGGAAVLVTRVYQQRAAASLFDRYASAARAPVALETHPAGPERTLVSTREWLAPLPSGSPRVTTTFLAIQFRDRSCPVAELPLTLRYASALPELDFSEPMTVRLRPDLGSQTNLFFAAYDRPDESTRFRGIELASVHAMCVDSVVHVRGLETTPLLLTTILQADWRREALYQRLR